MDIRTIRSCIPVFEEMILLGLETEAAGIPVLAAGMCKKENRLLLVLFSEGKDTSQQQEKCVKLERKRRKGTLTKREELMMSLEMQRETCLLDVIRGIRAGGREYEFRSAGSGRLEEYNLEGMLLMYYFLYQNMSFGFLETLKLPLIECTTVELEGEYEEIPFSRKELQTMEFLEEKRGYHVPARGKMRLKMGKQAGRKQTFTADIPDHHSERKIPYYINNVRLEDTWSEERAKYDKMLEEGILSEGKEYQMFLDHLQEICPPGMRNLVVEYECEEASLEFYVKEQLQEKLKIKEKEGAAAFFLAGNAAAGKGIHGKALKGCLIQYPVAPDISEVELELLGAFILPETKK